MGGEIFVAQPEPLGSNAIGGKFVLDDEGFALTSPAALVADPTAEGVHDRIEIRADLQSMESDVVAVVHDDGEFGSPATLVDEGAQATDEPRPANSAS